MHSSFLKQLAYNQRIFKAEDAISAINVDIADFLLNYSTDPAEPAIICLSAGESMKRHEQAVAGQLWMQGDGKMSGANVPLPGLANDSSAALLTAVVEPVEWKHPAEPPTGKRPGQRVVIYPPELDRLQSVLSTDKSQWDVADGPEEACERIASARDSFEHLPLFFTSDQEELKNQVDPSKIDEWMTTAFQIATGGRKQIPEDGPDVMNSERHSDNEQHGDQLPGAYIGIQTNSNGDPLGSAHHMENSQADELRRQAKEASRVAPTPCS
jgi:hypothetical protein